MIIEAVSVCFHYSDYLRIIMPNRHVLDRWVIATHPDDVDTINLCEYHGLEYVLESRIVSKGKPMNKGAGLNAALESCKKNHWLLILDCDIILPENMREHLDLVNMKRTRLYGASRMSYETYRDYLKKRNGKYENCLNRMSGYFHLYHSDNHRPLSEQYPTAAGVDVEFRDRWAPRKRSVLDFEVVHIGPMSTNWRGRCSPPITKEVMHI